MNRKANQVRGLLCVLLLLVMSCTAARGEVIYVDVNADGLNIGTSWEHAINSLQDALLLAYFSDKPVEMRVAQGTYTPDRGLGIMPGDSSASFQLINGVTIKGGYAANLSGHRGQPDVRDINQYKSILSGDLNADDGPGLTNIEENSDHVITSSENDATAVLDGFAITGSGIGRGGATPNAHTGGMYNDQSSPALIDCTFTGNLAAERGSGMYNNNSNPMLLNCIFSENDAPDGGAGMYNNNSSPMLTNCAFSANSVGGHGAGMYNSNSRPVLLNCIFTSNAAGMSGGGMYNEKSVPTLTHCTFADNSAGRGGGGGMYNEDSITLLADCTFRGNSATASGGGMSNSASKPMLLSCIFSENSTSRSGWGLYNYNASEASLRHCVFSGNRARDGGGMENFSNSSSTLLNCTFNANFAEHAGGGVSNIHDGHLTLVNCILWADAPDEIQAAGPGGRIGEGIGRVEVSYSNIQNSWRGPGNLDSDSLFADPENGDFHLRSQGGRWRPVSQDWVVDEISSPCIDAGSPEESVGLERFPNGGRINMGAYGGTPEASLTPQFLSQSPGRASNPDPDEGAVDVDIESILSWTGGLDAIFHDVYLGTDRNTVANSDVSDTTDVYRGRLSSTSYAPPEDLEWGQTYYWRIDEVDRDGRTTTGDVWTFTTRRPPKGRTCFTAETNVWISGGCIHISKVAIGQSICGMNNLSKIQKVEEHNGTFACFDILLESGNCISVAENHYFLTESGQWISLKDLRAGIKLQTLKGPIEIISVIQRSIPYIGKVYNLKIADSDRYLVGQDAVIVRDY